MTALNTYLPYRGEFGHKIMWHVPWVHAQPSPKAVCCEEGEEALFPSASHHIVVPRPADKDRREMSKYDADFRARLRHDISGPFVEPLAKHPRKNRGLRRFLPQPHKRITDMPDVDIVVCPRWRKHGEKKNWPHWKPLTELLATRYNVYAAGAPDSSVDVPCPHAWDHGRFLDATIQAMAQAKVVIATDAGLAHLAMLMGRPLLVISHKTGLVAPGYREIDWQRYKMANHRNAPAKILNHTWNDPNSVARWASKWIDNSADNWAYWANRYETLGLKRTAGNCKGGIDRETEKTSQLFRRALSVMERPPHKLLDYGCGYGRLAPALSSLCNEYYGCDIVKLAVDTCLCNGFRCHQIKAGRIPYYPLKFDAIVTCTVLQHVVSDDVLLQTLKRFYHRTNAGGWLFCLENISHRTNKSHIRFRRLTRYQHLLKQAGFNVVRVFHRNERYANDYLAEIDRDAANPDAETHVLFCAERGRL